MQSLFLIYLLGVPIITIGTLLFYRKRKQKETRKPFDENLLLRRPGQSIEEKLEKLSEAWGTSLFIICAYPFALFAWTRATPTNTVQSVFYIAATALICVVFAFRLKSQINRWANYRLGLQGERYVGQLLEKERTNGYFVFHDLVIKSKTEFNIDHILIAPTGIHVFETKCWRVREGISEAHKVAYDGQKLKFFNGKSSDAPILQVKRNELAIRKLLQKRRTNKQFQIHSIVVIPKWYIDRKGKGDVNVITSKEIPYSIKKPAPQTAETLLSENDISDLCEIFEDWSKNPPRLD